MSEEVQQEDITKKKVVYQIPGMDDVTIRLDVEYQRTEAGVQMMDLYSPADANKEAQLPAVIFVSGYPDAGMQKMLGCKLKEMGSYVSWAKLTAATGVVAITYSAAEPVGDLAATLIRIARAWKRRKARIRFVPGSRIGAVR